jgi:hypothetical protein
MALPIAKMAKRSKIGCRTENQNKGAPIMKMLLHAVMPNEPFNSSVRNGTAGITIKKILDDIKPEAVYFTEYGGKRGAILIVDVADPSKVPAICEPFFLAFNAEVSLHAVMTPEDLAKAGLDKIGKKWG